MEIGVCIDQSIGLSFSDLISLASDATKLGYSSIWTSRAMVPDAFHVCEHWWEESARHKLGGIRTGIGVLPVPEMWRPQSLAAQAGTISSLSDGKFILGIGTGGYGEGFWNECNMPNRPIAIMRDFVIATRAALSGEEVNYDGAVISLHHFTLGVTPPKVPIYLGALGPQMLRLAGSHADGVVLNWAMPPDIASSKALIEEGAVRVGRKLSDVSVAMHVRVSIDEDEQAARRTLATKFLSSLVGGRDGARRPIADTTLGYRGHFGRMGFEPELAELDRKRAAGTLTPDDPSDKLMNSIGYFGGPADAPKRFLELSAGLDEALVRIVATKGNIDAVRETMRVLSPRTLPT